MLHVISRSVDHIWIGAGTNTKVIFIIIKIRKVWAKDFLWWTSCHVEQTSQSRIMLGAQARERLEKGSLGHGMGVCGPLVHPRGWKCLTWTSCWGDGSVGHRADQLIWINTRKFIVVAPLHLPILLLHQTPIQIALPSFPLWCERTTDQSDLKFMKKHTLPTFDLVFWWKTCKNTGFPNFWSESGKNTRLCKGPAFPASPCTKKETLVASCEILPGAFSKSFCVFELL